MRTASTGNGHRFAATPLAAGGTPAPQWLSADRPPPLDLSECTRLVVIGAHPDDETLGMGATIAQLAASRVDVELVSASDGGAAQPGATAAEQAGLEGIRRGELTSAATVLGARAPISLGLPDGRLGENEERIASVLTEILVGAGPGTWCAATWRGDGHPDHEAVGRAAVTACARTGVQLVEYPVWMWHWAVPGDPDVPWQRAHTLPLETWAVERKQQAAQCFRSQFEPRGPDAVLPPVVLDRLMAVGEMVFR